MARTIALENPSPESALRGPFSLPHPGSFLFLATLALAILSLPGNSQAGALKKGHAPPDIQWMTAAGDTLSWDGLRQDQPLVLVFWATWCRACKKDWPELQKLEQELADTPAAPRWASVSLGEPAERVIRVAEERHLPGAVLVDPDEECSKRLGIKYTPTVCLLDPEGAVAYVGQPRVKQIRRLLNTFAEAT